MPSYHHRFFALTVTALAIALSPASPAVEHPHSVANIPLAGSEINDQIVLIEIEAVTAWTKLQATDAEIPGLIERGQFGAVSEQSEIIKAAATIIGQKLRVSDKPIKRRLDSVVPQVIAFADHLQDAAASGKSSRVATAYQNLHRYVEWAQAHLPPVPLAGATAGRAAG